MYTEEERAKFRQRFTAWKNGKKPYEAGLPVYQDGLSDDEQYDQAKEDAAFAYKSQVEPFIQKYYNSPGFRERFKKGAWKKGFSFSKYDPDNTKHSWGTRLSRDLEYSEDAYGTDTRMNAWYDPNTKEVTYDPRLKFPITDRNQKIAFDWDDVFSHELGHALEQSVLVKSLNGNKSKVSYSESIPIFRKSKAYQQILKNRIKQGLKTDESNVDSFIDPDNSPLEHDAYPKENYADLVQLRYLLYKNGIFDSTKKGLKFTNEHLNKYKKLNVPKRLLNNFSDSDIIWMINNVANNTTKINPLSV